MVFGGPIDIAFIDWKGLAVGFVKFTTVFSVVLVALSALTPLLGSQSESDPAIVTPQCEQALQVSGPVKTNIDSFFSESRRRAETTRKKQQAFSAMLMPRRNSFAHTFPSSFKKMSAAIEEYGSHYSHWDEFFPDHENATWIDFYNGMGVALGRLEQGLLEADAALRLSLSKYPAADAETVKRRAHQGNNWLNFMKSYFQSLQRLYADLQRDLPKGRIRFDDGKQANQLILFGKRFDALLGEMRLACVLPDVLAVGMPASEFIKDLQLSKVHERYYKREFDIIYASVDEQRVIVADAKSYDLTFDGKDLDRKFKLINQIKAQLTILNAYRQLPVGVEFYFLGGIERNIKMELETVARNYIRYLRPDEPSTMTFEIIGEGV